MSNNPILPVPNDEEPVDGDESADNQDTVETDLHEGDSVNENLDE
jgi:hypothetical protein